MHYEDSKIVNCWFSADVNVAVFFNADSAKIHIFAHQHAALSLYPSPVFFLTIRGA